jgi:DNA-binding GntR family transcriptional regulator
LWLLAFRVRRTAMAASIRHRAAARPRELTQLRLLLELSALRRLADRGLSDQELALVKKLANDTVRSARSGDVLGYLRADMTFHLCLLELTGDPALAGIARLLLAPDRLRAPRAEEPGYLMAREAREHRELAGLLADGMVSAADHLLRLHLSRLSAARPAPALPAGPESVSWAGA